MALQYQPIFDLLPTGPPAGCGDVSGICGTRHTVLLRCSGQPLRVSPPCLSRFRLWCTRFSTLLVSM